MEDKNTNEKNRPSINKIKYFKRLSPSHKDIYIRKKKSDESNEKNNYINIDNNNKNISNSIFNHNQKQIPTEKDLFRDRTNKNESKEKEKNRSLNNSINRSKNLTPLIHKYRKKNFYSNNNNIGIVDFSKNTDDSIDKKNKLYENQREPSFLNKYMAKIRENGTYEKNENGNLTYRENSRTKENIRLLIENINKKKSRENINNIKDDENEHLNKENKFNNNFYNNKSRNNELNNLISQSNESNKDNKNISFNEDNDIINDNKEQEEIIDNKEDLITIDNSNKINIFMNEIPNKNAKDSKNKLIKNYKQTKRNKKNKSVEIRKKNLNIPNINLFSISNSSMNNNLNYHMNSEESNNNNDNTKLKISDYNNSNDINKENNLKKISKKINKLPKLNLNTKAIKQNSMTERGQTNNNNNYYNENNLCLLCKKKCKKPLMCPKCHKICCELCIKSKKKKNKFCSYCNYYLKDISKYIEIKNSIINNKNNNNNIKRNIKNKNIKDIKEDSLNKNSGNDMIIQNKSNIYSHSKNNSIVQNTPSFKQKNMSEKKERKTKNRIKITSQKEEKENEKNDENNKSNKKIYDNNKLEEGFKTKKFYEAYIDRNKKYNSNNERPKKEKIKQKESIDIYEFELNNYNYNKIKENKKDNEIMLSNSIDNNLGKNFFEKEKQDSINSNNNTNKINENNEKEKKDNDNDNNNDNNNNNDTNNNNNDNYNDDNYNDKDNDNNKDNILNSDNDLNSENKNSESNNDNINNKKEKEKVKIENICILHNLEIKCYCIQCEKECCEVCLNNHFNEHNLIDYSIIDIIKFKELLNQKKENDNKSDILQYSLDNIEQIIKSYKLEKDLFIIEINKIANNYINEIESKINEINMIVNRIKNEQNIIFENKQKINEYLIKFSRNYIENNNNNNNQEDLILNDQVDKTGEFNNIDYTQYIKKYNNNNNNFKFNYFSSHGINNISLNKNSNIVLFSKIYFDNDAFINFINDLKYNNNRINITNDENNSENELKKILFDNININCDTFIIKNIDNKALIQVNLLLNKNNENINDNNIFYDNINCYLLISNKDMNNYCQLEKKMISNGNLCLYDLIDWEKFNIFNYSNLYFKVILFNHYK